MSTNLRRAVYFTIAPLVCLLLFWRVFHVWFLNDDFAWLGLRLSVHSMHQIWVALFEPQAQGTIRVLSERLYFLVFSTLFGLNPVFYRLWTLLTWFACLALAAAIGSRLTGSRAAGLLAVVLWTSSVAVTRALAWASAYDQVLSALCLLAAFYARLRWLETTQRRWQLMEWAAYLAGFGALETIVMYPLLAALHGWCAGLRKWTSIAALCVPAAAFTVFHFAFLPPNPAYPIVVNSRMPVNFLHYLGWSIGPRSLGPFPGHFHRRAALVLAATGLSLAAFVVSSVRRREFMPVFFCGWFVLMLAPVLPLPNNVQDYYLTVPVLGLAWLAGAALVAAWNAGWIPRAAALALLALYLPGSILQINDSLDWFVTRTQRLRVLVTGVRDAARAHPGDALMLEGVDADLYQSGFWEDPFRLLGVKRIYVAKPVGDFEVASRFLPLGETGPARILKFESNALRDVTPAAPAPPEFGPEWYPPEQGGFRWMPRRATVKLFSGGTLHITGYIPAILLKSGPVELHLRAADREIGAVTLRKPDEMFTLEFPLPPATGSQIELTIEVNKTTRVPGDSRELGMIFQSFEIR